MFLTCRRRLKVDCTELCLNIHIDALFIAFYYGYKQLNKIQLKVNREWINIYYFVKFNTFY